MRSGPRGFGWLLVALLVVSPVVASACSCTNNLTLQEEFDHAACVFSGRVLAVQPSPFGDWFEVVLEPIARWKGAVNFRVVVVTSNSEGTCGYPFTAGEEYLVFCGIMPYGLTMSPAYWTHLCAKTSPLADNPFVPLLPAPLLPTPAARPTWGALKTIPR